MSNTVNYDNYHIEANDDESTYSISVSDGSNIIPDSLVTVQGADNMAYSVRYEPLASPQPDMVQYRDVETGELRTQLIDRSGDEVRFHPSVRADSININMSRERLFDSAMQMRDSGMVDAWIPPARDDGTRWDGSVPQFVDPVSEEQMDVEIETEVKIENQHLTRQIELIPLRALDKKINVIGVGAIGSFVVLSLAKMGFHNIEVWDADTVSVENMNSQFYRFSDIDKPKVKALKELVKDFTGVTIKTNMENYEEGQLDGIVIAAVDSMAVRKTIWFEQHQKSPRCNAVIDPRMGAESALLYVTDPMGVDLRGYDNSFYSDDEAVQERCTAKATVYTATMLAGLVVKAVKDLVVKGKTFDSVNWSIKDDDFICHDRKKQKEKTPRVTLSHHIYTQDSSADHLSRVMTMASIPRSSGHPNSQRARNRRRRQELEQINSIGANSSYYSVPTTVEPSNEQRREQIITSILGDFNATTI